jgi:hypothetical protein
MPLCYTSWHIFWLHVCKVVFDQAFSSLPLFMRFGMCIQAKPFHPSPCSRDLECAFKQNLFIPPLVHNIWMCIQAKPSHPSPCSQHLDVHSSKTFSSLPLFKTFGCAFKLKPFHPSPCSRHLDVHSSKTFSSLPLFKTFACAFKQKPYLPSPQNLHANTEGLGWVVYSHVLKICMPIQVTSCFFPSCLCKVTFGYMFPWSWDFGWKKFPPSAPWGDY